MCHEKVAYLGGVTVRLIPAILSFLIALQAATNVSDTSMRLRPELSATEVMKHVVDTYQSLSTYSDRGTSITKLSPDGPVYTVKFETLFKRQNKLRFAWTLEYSGIPAYKRSNVIWSDGESVWASYSSRGGKPERKISLEVAVAGAIGASWAAAHRITSLLSEEVGGVRLDQLQGLMIVGNDTVDGVRCTVVSGYLKSGTERKLWIDSKDYLIRRIAERSDSTTVEQLHTQILVNQDIANSRFSEQGR